MSTRKVKYGTSDLRRDYGPITFGQLLADHRRGEDWTQDEMAKRLGISKQSLCDLEKGRRVPTPARAASIARKLQMHEGYFVQVALQDHLNNDGLNLHVEITKGQKQAG